MTLFNVHIYREMRLSYPGIEAISPPCEWLIDLLTDFRHWCDSNGRSFEELDAQARRHYLAELDEEA